MIRDWVAAHGWVCPGYNRPSHPATDLEGEHRVGLAQGGDKLATGNVDVMCKSSNLAKGNDARRARGDGPGGSTKTQLFSSVATLVRLDLVVNSRRVGSVGAEDREADPGAVLRPESPTSAARCSVEGADDAVNPQPTCSKLPSG